jgi:hypothetical protein
MEYFKENTIKVLKELVRNCKFAEGLLKHSAKDFDDESLRRIFLYYAEQNAGYIRKLNSEILRLGGSPDDVPEEEILVEDIETVKDRLKFCESGINNAVKSYKDVSLREDILWEVVPVIAKQYYGEMEVQEKIKVLSSVAN